MKGIVLAFALSFMLLFAGCASQQQQPAPQAQQQPAAPQPPAEVKNETPAPPEPEKNETPAAAEPEKCAIEFQKDSSSVYYVMVRADSQNEITVVCPNGKEGEKRGELYFCGQLDIDNPAIAYIGKQECGRLNFQRAAYENVATGALQCTVFLAPDRIAKGQSSEITVQTSTGGKEVTLTYNCGSGLKSQKRSGIVTDGSICTFDTPGELLVEAKLDGETCDTAILSVFEKPKECFVLSSSLEMMGEEYVYSARVAGRGYSGNDELAYRCYGIPHAIKVSTIPKSTDFLTAIECRSKSGPLTEPVKVSVGGDFCGQLVPPESG